MNQRYLSLDVLRGLTIAFMIIVNSPGNAAGSFSQLKHAAWNGFTLTDLVFPTFLFVVGNAMSFTMKKYSEEDQSQFIFKVFKRTVIIYLIGIFLNVYPFFATDYTSIRLVHVLGRIAICYCAMSLMIYYAGPVTAYVVSAISLLLYWWILYHFGDQPDPYGLTGNAVAKLDVLVWGVNHIWHGEGVPFDPEGLLSTLPAIANVSAGYFIGDFIQRKGVSKSTILWMIAGGLILVLTAILWNNVFPINKKIWTSSYVLMTVGLDLMILSTLLYVIEIMRVRRGLWFFEVFGKNPLALYVLSYLIIKLLYYIPIDEGNAKDWIYRLVFEPLASPAFSSLLFSLSVMMIVWAVGYFLDRKKLYIKV